MANQQRDVVQPIELFAATYHYVSIEAARGGWGRLSKESKEYYLRFAGNLNIVRNPISFVGEENGKEENRV